MYQTCGRFLRMKTRLRPTKEKKVKSDSPKTWWDPGAVFIPPPSPPFPSLFSAPATLISGVEEEEEEKRGPSKTFFRLLFFVPKVAKEEEKNLRPRERRRIRVVGLFCTLRKNRE